MAKTIKFNLILDGNPVRTLEGLRENFSIEDILVYFDNGLLLRWLDVRGFKSEYEAVSAIDKKGSNKNKLIELIKIFDVETDKDSIEEGLEIIDFTNQTRKLNESYKNIKDEKNEVIRDYYENYDKLIKLIVDNKDNLPVLKANAKYLEEEYFDLFKLTHETLFDYLIENAPMTIFALLMRGSFREYWLGEKAPADVIQSIRKDLIPKAKEILKNEVKVTKGVTDDFFFDICDKGQKVMIVSIDDGMLIKSQDRSGANLFRKDVDGKLLILDGLMYKCNSNIKELLYLEV